MILHLPQTGVNQRSSGLTLIEVMVAMVAFGLTVGGLLYGYTQVNRMAEWSSMSLAAQSYASQGLEQAKSAQWNYSMWPITNGPGTGDELGYSSSVGQTNYERTTTMDIPTTGTQIFITNYITISTVTNIVSGVTLNVPLRQIRADCVWVFPMDGRLCTNTAITLRAPDQ